MNDSINPKLYVSTFTNIYTKYDSTKITKSSNWCFYHEKIYYLKIVFRIFTLSGPIRIVIFFSNLLQKKSRKLVVLNNFYFLLRRLFHFKKYSYCYLFELKALDWKTVRLKKHPSNSRLVYRSKEKNNFS